MLKKLSFSNFFGKILEHRETFEIVFRKLGRNFAKMRKLEKPGNTWEKTEKYLKIFKKMKK